MLQSRPIFRSPALKSHRCLKPNLVTSDYQNLDLSLVYLHHRCFHSSGKPGRGDWLACPSVDWPAVVPVFLVPEASATQREVLQRLVDCKSYQLQATQWSRDFGSSDWTLP